MWIYVYKARNLVVVGKYLYLKHWNEHLKPLIPSGIMSMLVMTYICTVNPVYKLHILALYGSSFLMWKHENLQRKFKCKPEHLSWDFKQHCTLPDQRSHISDIVCVIHRMSIWQLHTKRHKTNVTIFLWLSLTLNLPSYIFHLSSLPVFYDYEQDFEWCTVWWAMVEYKQGLSWLVLLSLAFFPPSSYAFSLLLFLPLSLQVCFLSLSLSLPFSLALSLPDLYFTLPLLSRLPPWNQLLGNQLQRLPER